MCRCGFSLLSGFRALYPAGMFRYLLGLFLAATLFATRAFAYHDDGPAISITSPDVGTTFVYGSIKSRVLFWNKKAGMLIARVTFTDAQSNNGQPNEDPHDFRLPGVTCDEAKGIFYATSAKGEAIPVAHIKKTLFIKSVEVLPNAVVRVQRLGGTVTVILEAISPNDPAMHPAPSGNSDGTQKVDANKIIN